MISNFKDVDGLSPGDFEILVRDIFEASGWSNSEITKVGKEFKHGDGGVDIFAYKGGRKFAIEVKQRNLDSTVDVKALNQLVTGAKLANVTNKILVTNSYFTSEVKARALRLGVELVDRDGLQNLWLVKHSEIGRDIKPRSYQQEVIDEAIDKYKTGKSKLLIEMATGLGKTYTVAHLIKRLIQASKSRPKILFLAHQVEILLQSVTAFKNVLGIGNYSFSACFSGSRPEETDFVFASFDTLYGQINELKKEMFDFVIVDEAHHTAARTYSEVVTLFKPRLLVGLTATPYRADNKDVISFFGGDDGHIGRYDLAWGLKSKRLALPKYLVLLDDLDQEKIDQLESGLSISDLDKRLFLHKKDEEVVRIIENKIVDQKIDKVKGIVFCRNIRHMQHLMGFFELGSATLVHSKMSDQERRENIRNFREGDFKFILVCDLFNEGVDIPETNLLVFMRHTGSRTIWLQQLGRGLRKTPNKEFVHVLDFVGSLERLNEIKELSKSVERAKVNRADCLDDVEDIDKKTVFHDGSLNVEYSEEAVKVLTLIDSMRGQIKSREILLEKIRAYREDFSEIPGFHEFESSIDGVSIESVATHFGSYYAFLIAAFDDEIDKSSLSSKIVSYIDSFYQKNRIMPSVRAISHAFKEGGVFEFVESDIEELVPSINSVITLKDEKEALDGGDEEGSFAKEMCPYIEEYKNKINSRADLKNIPGETFKEILDKYKSISVFLKRLNDVKRP